MAFVERRPQFFHGGVFGPRQQVLHDEEALRGTAHAGRRKGSFDSGGMVKTGLWSQFRNNSKIAQRLAPAIIQIRDSSTGHLERRSRNQLFREADCQSACRLKIVKTAPA